MGLLFITQMVTQHQVLTWRSVKKHKGEKNMANINQITLIDTNKPEKVKEKLNELIQEVSGMESRVPTKSK